MPIPHQGPKSSHHFGRGQGGLTRCRRRSDLRLLNLHCGGDKTVVTAFDARMVFGKRIGFLEREDHPTINLADIAMGNRQIRNLRHFTLSESWDFPSGWASDSKNLFLLSSRNGPFT